MQPSSNPGGPPPQPQQVPYPPGQPQPQYPHAQQPQQQVPYPQVQQQQQQPAGLPPQPNLAGPQTTQPYAVPPQEPGLDPQPPPVDTEPPSGPKKVQQQVQQQVQSTITSLKKKLQPETPAMGFVPTAAMVQQHESSQQQQQQQQQAAPLFQFQVTKLRSWRTGYLRILRLHAQHWETLDPTTHQVTNRWSYSELTDWLAIPQETDTILLQVQKDKLKFQCLEVPRPLVLSALLHCKGDFAERIVTFTAKRQTRHRTRVPVFLRATPYAIWEVHSTTRRTLQVYRYTDICAISLTSDDPQGIVLHMHKRRRLFYVETSPRQGGNGRSDLVQCMQDCFEILGLEFGMQESWTTQAWLEERLVSHPLLTISYPVLKQTKRHDPAYVGNTTTTAVGGMVHRRLALGGQHSLLLELDGSGVVSMRPLSHIYAIVRHPHGNDVTLEFTDGSHRTYTCSCRDALIVSIVDAASSIQLPIHITSVHSTGYSLAPLGPPLEETKPSSTRLFAPLSVPQHCLKRIHSVATAAYAFIEQQQSSNGVVPECWVVVEACHEFNASVSPTGQGLPTGVSDKQVLGSIGALWGLVSKLLLPTSSQDRQQGELAASPLLESLYRLVKTPAGYKTTAELTTLQDCIPHLYSIQDDFCKYWAFSVLNVLLSGTQPKRNMEVEYVNKSIILKTGGPDLIGWLVSAFSGSSDLILMVASDMLQSILCSYHDTTREEHFRAFIDALALGHRALLSTLRSRTPFVIENTALLLHLLSTHAPQISLALRDAALSSATLLHHFHAAIFSPLEGQRFLSRYLCSLWFSGDAGCDEKRLLRRMVPKGFFGYLNMPMLSRVEEEQLDELERDAIEENVPDSGDLAVSATGAGGTNTSRLRARIALATARAASLPGQPKQENFRIFFHVLTQDHALADLIWNQQTRRELRIALESEIQYIQRETEARGIDQIAWNHQQFIVNYPSLDNEVKVGSVYMRLWLQAGDAFIKTWDEPVRLFELLFRRFLCEIDRDTKVTIMCIRCLERLYAIHANKIGPFTDVMILVRSMASTRSIETQHRLLGLLATILGVSKNDDDEAQIDIPENAEQLLNRESLEQLCQYVAWGHTNGVQVGNLLTSVLAKGLTRHAMITDGTSVGPEGAGTSDSSNVALDASCPPVWYLASTGRIPPPLDMIRGPFRVSELMKMKAEGDLNPFDLVSAAHVEDYDQEEKDQGASVKETQIDKGTWKRIDRVWQLRWQLCTDGTGGGIFSPAEVARMAIRSLTRLVDLHKSLDSRGVPYYPIPIAKRILCGLSRDPSTTSGVSPDSLHQDSFLAIISQSLLCNDHLVINETAELLYKLTLYNEEAMSKFYLTGVFFFIACYTGNNIGHLAKLLHASHLKQHFRSGFAAAANENELSTKERSVLGNMLPEGVLLMLVNYGAERFAEVFVGNYDTPEVIWNLEMRKHLIEMVRQHLGDFPNRLWQNTTTRYEYCPLPGIAFKRLEKEIFCHNYYLNNLCDEKRFPNWPIKEPVEVFRACLEEFKKQMNRDEEEEESALEDARKTLDLKPGDGSRELRKSYRTLARKYHPDKNPAGREMFEAIQSAYELLLPVVESGQKIKALGPEDGGNVDSSKGVMNDNASEGLRCGADRLEAMHLLIKTQLLICKRYEKEMGLYKYPAYSILLSCLEMPSSCKEALAKDDSSSLASTALLKPIRADFVSTTVELVFQTCLVSPLNAEELVIEGGVQTLEILLDFYLHVGHFMGREDPFLVDVVSETTICEIIAHIVHTLAGVAYYENGRAAILALSDPSRFCINWRRCIDGKFLGRVVNRVGDSSIKKFALEGIGNMAKAKELQGLLIGSGVVWPLIRCLLAYDPTLEQVSVVHADQDDIGISQASSNAQARLSARALGMLAGVLRDPGLACPYNEPLVSALSQLLTSPIALMLRNKRTTEVLKTLNTNVETPARIWNVRMRSELGVFLTKLENERPEKECLEVEVEVGKVATFEFSGLKDELQIGGVYVRVFNNLGSGREALREVKNPTAFANQVTNFIAASINASDDLLDEWIKVPLSEQTSGDETLLDNLEKVPLSDARFAMAVTALQHLVRVDGLIDDVLCEASSNVPALLLSLLELPQDSEAFDIGCDILSLMSPKQAFADAVARHGALWRLLWILERPEGSETDDQQPNGDVRLSDPVEETRRKQRGWALLEALSSTPSVANKLVESSGWLELLGILVGYKGFTKTWVARTGAAKILSRLLWDPRTGPLTVPLLQRFLPPALGTVLKEEGPDVMLKVFDGKNDTPELIWDAAMRAELRAVMDEQLDMCLDVHRKNGFGTGDYTLPPEVRVKYKNLEDELYIGGVYVSRFLKEPTYNLRDPTHFLEMLLKRWAHELDVHTKGGTEATASHATEIVEARQDVLQLVTSASVYICKVRESLCDRLAQWGYMARSLSLLDEILSRELLGSPLICVMRLLHVAANRRANVESIAASGGSDGKRGIVDFTIKAIGWDPLHPDCAFMIELLKKVFQQALGDTNTDRTGARASSHPGGMGEKPHPNSYSGTAQGVGNTYNAMAPSPAPGEGPVSRGKVSIGDDPLAMAFQSTPASQGRPPNQHQGAQTGVPSSAPASAAGGQGVRQSGLSFVQRSQMLSSGPTYPQSSYQARSSNSYTYNNPQTQAYIPQNAGFVPQSQPAHHLYGGSHGSSHQTMSSDRVQQATSNGPDSHHAPPPSAMGSATPNVGRITGSSSSSQGQTPGVSSWQNTAPAPSAAIPGLFERNNQSAPQSTVHGPAGSTYGGIIQQRGPTMSQFGPGPMGAAPAGSGMGHTRLSQEQGQQSMATYSNQQAYQQPRQQTARTAQSQINETSQQLPSTHFQQYQASQTTPSTHFQQYQASQTTPSTHFQQYQASQASRQTIPPSQQYQTQSPQQIPAGAQHQANQVPERVPEQQQLPVSSASNQQYHPAPVPSQQFQTVGAQSQPHPVTVAGASGYPYSQPQTLQQQSLLNAQPDSQPQGQHYHSQQPYPQTDTIDIGQGKVEPFGSSPEPVPQRTPVPVEGTGVDARSKPDPQVEADQQARSMPGASDAAEGRVSLLESALICQLPKFLVNDVLENATLANVKDPAAAKVHSVDLLKLLTTDPGYGPKFQLILGELPAWKKYALQDHSLFITGVEQKADYFLTDGSSGEPKKLLTQG